MPRSVCFALSICLFGSAAMAQGDAMTELYGQGVHLYFSGDYTNADEILSKVVDSGSLDPRAHYFRGLAREMQGGGGNFDFENGARLETEGKRVVSVGLALTRVQGVVRTKIETARRDARVVQRQQQLLAEQARRDAAGAAVPSDIAPAIPSETVMPDDPIESDPFASDGLRSDSALVDPVQPAASEVDATNNPFGDDPLPGATDAPASNPPATDPFGGGTPATGTDPFGGGQPATGADPFGGGQPATGADPFGGGEPATGADPFGGGEPAPGSDPFGGAGTSGAPPVDDPFGTGL